MGLSTSLSVALSGLSTTSEQLSIVSRNVARANEEGATRKIAKVETLDGGGARVASVARLANDSLLSKLLLTNSDAGKQKVISDALDQFDPTINDPSLDGSPSQLISKLTTALQTFASSPQDSTAANSAITAARSLAQGLQDATLAVQKQRTAADQGIANSVQNLNQYLTQFQTLNDEIVRGTGNRADITDLLDQRDQLVGKISQEIGVRTTIDGNNSMSLYTDQGVTLFNGVPRSVTFQNTASFGATTTGNAVYVDGVAITGGSGPMQSQSGKIVGYATVRDNLGISYQNQLDEIARGLIEAFSETDATGANPTVPGLFTYDGAPTMPATGQVTQGLAASIKLNPAVDSSKGGNPTLLRDGGINGTAYVYNTTGATGYTDRLQGVIDGLSNSRSFDQSALLINTGSLSDFSSASAGWLQEQRKSATSASDYATTLQQRASDALSKDTGVNIDEEMTNMLQFERSYQASARVMTTIDSMFQTLLGMYK